MAEEIYNPSTDNREEIKNPLTELVERQKKEQQEEDWRKKLEQESRKQYEESIKEKYAKRKESKPKKEEYPYLSPGKLVKFKKSQKKLGESISKLRKPKSMLGTQLTGMLGARQKRPIKDQLKVLRLQNMLDKKRLQNQIEKFKLAKQIESLRKRGMLKQIISQPIMRVPQRLYPYGATPEIMGDIDSVWNADINPSNNDMWGNESFFGGENYYDEEYFDDELNLSPWEHLHIKPRQDISPLLW